MGSSLTVTMCPHKVWREKYGCAKCDVVEGKRCASCEHRPVEAWMAEDGRGGGATLPCPKCGVANFGRGESASTT